MSSNTYFESGIIIRTASVKSGLIIIEFETINNELKTYYMDSRNYRKFMTWIGWVPESLNPSPLVTLQIDRDLIIGWR